MASEELQIVASQMVAKGKGILAADESSGTIEKKFAKIGVESTEHTRREYRELFFTTEGIEEFISGVILYDETLRQNASDGRSFVSILKAKGVLPGIKVDQGTTDMNSLPLQDGSQSEKVTKGLEGLMGRLQEYAVFGAKFTKWRAVITIHEGAGFPSDENIRQNAQSLAAYAKAAQDAGLVPIVEPEVLMDGGHGIEACEKASTRTLMAVFEELGKAGVDFSGMVLKTNMVIPGKDNGKAAPEEIARRTIALFKKVLPSDLPGQAFLSGGQSEVESTANLNAMNSPQSGGSTLPWNLTFSYGRALQDSALKTWNGSTENVAAAQKKFYHRAKMNSLATLGKYESSMEQ